MADINNKKGVVHLLPVLLVTVLAIGLVSLFSFSQANSISQRGAVLKDSDEVEEEDEVEEKEEDNSGSGNVEDRREVEPEETDSPDDDRDEVEDEDDETSSSESQMEVHDDGSVEYQFESEDKSGRTVKVHNQGEDSKVEIRLSETERIRVRTKDGEKRIDVYQGGVKVRFEYEDGRFVAKAEYEGEEDGVEIEDEDVVKIVEDLETNDIKISTVSGKLRLSRGNANAVTDFPLSIDVDTGSLVVTTPAGEKVVTILPDQAIANLLTANTLSSVQTEDSIELSEIDGEPVYEIKGVSRQRLLGIFGVNIQKEVDVSAETGDPVNVSQSFISRVIDAISF